MQDALASFERTVLDAFLAGADPRLELLRAQAAACAVASRRHSGVGAFVDLAVPAHVPRVEPPAMTLADVDVEIAGLPRRATAMLFVRLGALVLLEFVAADGDWPLHPVARSTGYIRYQPTAGGGYTLVPSLTRDPDTLALQLAGHKSTSRRSGGAE